MKTTSPVFEFRDPAESPNTVSMLMGTDNEPMLSISKDGFWVRGVKVPQDNKEAETVYNAFLQWMSYMTLTRNY
jgi:hypothetical protein